ncbi:MAG: hypothetical protein AAGF59_04085 [Pseudomonadota bacterium]
MTRLRLLPVVVFAVAALFLFRTIGWFSDSDVVVSPITPALAQENAPEAADGAETPAENAAQPETGEVQLQASADGGGDGTISLDPTASAETQILQRLGDRRKQLDKRAAELDLREQLLTAAENRVERRVEELKALEARIKTAESQRDEHETMRLQGLVKMYETMKPKDAARVFDRLSLDILVDVVQRMKPRKMSAILAKMSPDVAERLTVALATDRMNDSEEPAENGALPKINGTPTQ